MKKSLLVTLLLTVGLIASGTASGGECGKTRITVAIPDSILTSPAGVSIAVTDGALPVDGASTITSEILLNSEIKGNIENPRYYFENVNAEIDGNLDLLMMTQGWRRYAAADIVSDTFPRFEFPIEQSQSVSGHVEKSFNRNPKGMKLTLFYPQTLEWSDIELGDSSRFVIDGLDLVEGTALTLEATTKGGGTKTVSVHVNEQTFPQLSTLKNYDHPEQASDSVGQSFADFVKSQPRAVSLLDVQELGEVTVRAKKNRNWSNRSKVEPYRGYQQGDPKIGNFPSMESMLRSLNVKIRSMESGGALPEPRIGEYVMNEFMPTVVYIDGFRSDQSEVFILDPQNISSIEYFRPGTPEVASYAQEALFTGLILINTNYGNEGGRRLSLAMKNFTPLGYRPPVEFYVPKFHVDPLTLPYRATLYWNPNLMLSPSGRTEIELYLPDRVKSLNVTIQGIAPDGKIIDTRKFLPRP